MSTGSFTPIPPAFHAKGRPMILTLRPPVRAILIVARERNDNAVAMRRDGSDVTERCLYSGQRCDGRGVRRFVPSHADQRRDCECTDSPPHDISPFLFFFNDTATTEIYTLSLHDALPI